MQQPQARDVLQQPRRPRHAAFVREVQRGAGAGDGGLLELGGDDGHARQRRQRERRAGGRVVEIAEYRDQLGAFELEAFDDLADGLGLQPALAVGAVLTAIALALEVIDEHPDGRA